MTDYDSTNATIRITGDTYDADEQEYLVELRLGCGALLLLTRD